MKVSECGKQFQESIIGVQLTATMYQNIVQQHIVNAPKLFIFIVIFHIFVKVNLLIYISEKKLQHFQIINI